MKLVFKSFTLMAFFLLSNHVLSESTEGKVSVLRATSDSTQHPVENRNVLLLKLDTPFHENCPWVMIKSNNDYFVSTILSAQSQNKTVKIWYDEVNKIAGVCEAYTVEMK
ncbi:hypothetical protein [Pleionea litopenaei]|uniref:Uncharacterized protein n=1 Tax=Pleionea litopenaei TaxID=3070815 RepID=A0AA51RVV3_9GAMM|nr:hypothetical protein [Pleionea sp. HL-JVS1]WMS88409.1 hypothetical protein Q9312_05710 [Pleionea sp. HL-JVS1]